ncbi:hypothetical protein HQ520_05395 [bacterium]|nr:hypothetical protein [bacterium]
MTVPPPRDVEHQAILAQAPEDQRLYTKALLDWEEKNGRKNALLYYERATWLVSDELTSRCRESWDVAEKVINKGYYPEADRLKPLLEDMEPAIRLVEEGAAVDGAAGVGLLNRYDVTMLYPNYHLDLYLFHLLTVRGRWNAAEGRQHEAVQDHLTVLTAGRDFRSQGNWTFLSMQAGLSQNAALDSLLALVKRGGMSVLTLYEAAKGLEHIQMTTGEWLDSVRVDIHEHRETLRFMEEPSGIGLDELVRPRHYELGDLFNLDSGPDEWLEYFAERLDRVRIRRQIGVGLQYLDDVEDYYVRNAGRPWREYEPYPYYDLGPIDRCEDVFLWFNELGSSLMSNTVYILNTDARLRQVRLVVGLELYRSEKGLYPSSLGDLKERQIGTATVNDPFSGQPFRYEASPGSTSYRLWSVGPGKADEGETVKYDPTNGTLSAGGLF